MGENETIVFVNNEYVPRNQARIDPFDYGWRRGWVVYDAATVWQGYFFKLDRHIERLCNSLRMANIALPLNRQEIKAIFVETVRRNGLKDANVWMYVSYGVPTLNSYAAPLATPTVLCIATPFLWLFGPKVQETGVRTIISSIRNIPSQCIDPRLKHINRMNINMADIEAKAAGVEAPIMLDIDGCVTENNFANVFIIHSGGLLTPPEGAVLSGITRETIFEIAERQKIPVAEKVLKPYDLYNADEVFFSTSAGGLIPVVEISSRKVADGKPGPLTQRLSEGYWDMRKNREYSFPVFT